MKAIFLCDKQKNCHSVYSDAVLQKISDIAELDRTVYCRSDIISDPKRFADVNVIFSTWGMPILTESEIKEYFPSLECVFYGAGSVQAFARPFLGCGVKVFSAWAANAVPVAEYTVAQIILANKGFFAQTRIMSQADITRASRLKDASRGNYGSKVGLIGCGMIGSLVADMLKSYNLEVLAYDPFLSAERARELNVRTVSLDTLFSECAVVSNHLANNEATRGILKYGHFSSMPVNATFLNTGRGAQVVEADLVRALKERPDLSAVLDVTYPEPPVADHPFYTLENCFLTPHIAGSMGDEVARMGEYMEIEFEKYVKGSACKYEVSMEMLETMA